MAGFQRIGGLAAILAAATYLVGFWAYFTVLGPAQYGSASIAPGQHVAFLVENQQFMHLLESRHLYSQRHFDGGDLSGDSPPD